MKFKFPELSSWKAILAIVCFANLGNVVSAQTASVRHSFSINVETAPQPNSERVYPGYVLRHWEWYNRLGVTWSIGRHFGIGYDYLPIWSVRTEIPTKFYTLHGGHVRYKGRFKGLLDQHVDFHAKLAYAQGNYCFPEHFYQRCTPMFHRFFGGGIGGEWYLSRRFSANAEIVTYSTYYRERRNNESLMWFWFGVKWYPFFRIDPERNQKTLRR